MRDYDCEAVGESSVLGTFQDSVKASSTKGFQRVRLRTATGEYVKCSINHVNSIPFSHFLFIWPVLMMLRRRAIVMGTKHLMNK